MRRWACTAPRVTVGIAVGAPLAGAVIDASAPLWGFVVTGALGALVTLVVLPIELRRRRNADAATPQPVEVDLTPRRPLTAGPRFGGMAWTGPSGPGGSRAAAGQVGRGRVAAKALSV